MYAVGEETAFGHSMKSHFLFDSRWTNLNHGTHGTYPLPVRNALRGYQKLTEAAPDKFLDYQYEDLLDKSRERVARIINAPVDECVLIQNAITGINTILRNMTWQDKDAIIFFDTIEKASENTLFSIQEANPQLHLRKVGHNQDFGYSLPCTHAEILNAFSQTISRLLYDGYKPRVAMFDTIVSFPGVRFPFERLTKMCKEYGILSLIDGAHGIGQIPLNMVHLDPDFLVSDCHKWLYTPRGCAVLFVPKRNQHLIKTTIPTSHGFISSPKSALLEYSAGTKSDFVKLFQYTATTDESPVYCLPAACNFRDKLCGGEEAIYNHIRDVAQRGADLLASVLGTEVMDDLDPGEGLKAMGSYEGSERRAGNSEGWSGGLRDCAMANVLLPIKIAGAQKQGSLGLGPGGAGSGGGLTPGLGGGRKFSAGYASPQPSPGLPPESPWGDAMRSTSPTGTPDENGPVVVRKTDLQKHITWMMKTLVNEFQTGVQVFEYNGKVWTRVSGQIYLELRDFEWLGRILKGLCERIRMGESLRADAASFMKLRTQSTIDLEALGQGISNFNVS